MEFVDIGPECFTDTKGLVISYKGDNYYRACDAVVADNADGGQMFCVKRVGHPGLTHEAYDGTTRNTGSQKNYDAAHELAEAIRLTVEYVGNDMLPAKEGWSWFDALLKYSPSVARHFEEHPIHFKIPSGQSKLVEHARQELNLMGEEPDVIEGYLKTIFAFSEMGHSGGSAMVAIPTLNQLLQFKNLTPLTDNPEEWQHHDEKTWGAKGGIWQNKRNSEAFSTDGGKTYFLLSERNKDKIYPMHDSVMYKEK